jgi:hypothetical protein
MSTPDVVESPFGRLRFFDGVPTTESIHRIYDALDLIAPVPDPSVVHHLAGLPWLATRASSNDDGLLRSVLRPHGSGRQGHLRRELLRPAAWRTGASPQTIMARTSYAPRFASPSPARPVMPCPRPAAHVVHACDPLRVGPGFDDRLGPPGVEMLQQLVQVVTQRVE